MADNSIDAHSTRVTYQDQIYPSLHFTSVGF